MKRMIGRANEAADTHPKLVKFIGSCIAVHLDKETEIHYARKAVIARGEKYEVLMEKLDKKLGRNPGRRWKRAEVQNLSESLKACGEKLNQAEKKYISLLGFKSNTDRGNSKN